MSESQTWQGLRDEVLDFWFTTLRPAQWWKKDKRVDATIRERFGGLHGQAACAELWQWRESAEGRLAEILILDQFSRNLFREDGRAFACDALALALAQEAVAAGADRELPVQRRAFIYLPYMHSESLLIHAQALKLFAQPGLEDNLRAEREHLEVLRQFGRYPTRNDMLGRESSTAERAFLAR